MKKQKRHEKPRHRALPVGLVTTGRQLLIIGGGIDTVARTRHAAQFDWRAVRILLPAKNTEVEKIAARDPRMKVLFRAATEKDVKWADIIFKDSGKFSDMWQIAVWCRKHGRLLNCVDRAESCDLFYLAMVMRGAMVLGITSGGEAPALTAVMRRHLEDSLGDGWADAAEMMGKLRRKLTPGRKRMELLRKLANNSELIECVSKGNLSRLKRMFEDGTDLIRT